MTLGKKMRTTFFEIATLIQFHKETKKCLKCFIIIIIIKHRWKFEALYK